MEAMGLLMTPKGTGSRFARRVSQFGSILRTGGWREVSRRAARRMYTATAADALDFPLLIEDVSDSTRVWWPEPAERPERPDPLSIGWVMMPPSAGSGGHTTMLRMVEALESAGHRCVLYLYDRHASPAEYHRRTVREYWPHIRADVVDINDGLQAADALVATSWESAHVLAARGQSAVGRRLYFIQDYEPFFYGRGSEYALAEDTYAFGYRNIAVGHMAADLVRQHAPCDVIEFSCDSDVYHLTNQSDRSGVVFYSRPRTARRGNMLAVLALAEFHSRHPEHPIHVFGDTSRSFPFPFVHHARLTPKKLADLYNESVAGVGLSFTNISLIVEEMLACGVIPVVNDSPYSRADMPSELVEWASPTPAGICERLCRIVESDDITARAKSAAHSVRHDNWESSKTNFVDLVEAEIYGLPTATTLQQLGSR